MRNTQKNTDVCSWDASITPDTSHKKGPHSSKVQKVSVLLLACSCICCAVEVLVNSRACGQSYVSLYSLWVVPWGAVWLFWDNLLITIQYGFLEREPMEFPFSTLCEPEWTHYMSKSRHLLCRSIPLSLSPDKLFVVFYNAFKIILWGCLGVEVWNKLKTVLPCTHTWPDFVFQLFISLDVCVWGEFEHLRKRWFTEEGWHRGFGKRLMKYHHIRKCLAWMTQSAREIQRK